MVAAPLVVFTMPTPPALRLLLFVMAHVENTPSQRGRISKRLIGRGWPELGAARGVI
tara:strand:+ start:119 stop:289 length:171 start_codon:yes stop_codon:yes gene_type:complete